MRPITSISATKVIPQSLRMDLFSQLLMSIFGGQITPGSRLKTLQLASQFGVSSTPVREAIMELAGLGVVEIYPNRGAVVAPFGIREVREIYHLRSLLEVESARCACECDDLGPIAALIEPTQHLIEQAEIPNRTMLIASLDQRTHQEIATAAGNSRLKIELGRYDRLIHVVRMIVRESEEFSQRTLHEHLNLLNAIVDRDIEGAKAAMAAHLSQSCDRTIESLFFEPATNQKN
ncbi:GntR family transcriptional regulator [Planctomicrobium sp. SH668]|uniref:GntR family transcriptional regulator n=1 Tax=Planctomicrobium sp. SH668 TaxID=3448126 RepID=UPI003F5BBF51